MVASWFLEATRSSLRKRNISYKKTYLSAALLKSQVMLRSSRQFTNIAHSYLEWSNHYSGSIMFNHVQSCSIMFNHVQSCSIMFNHVQSPLWPYPYLILLRNHIFCPFITWLSTAAGIGEASAPARCVPRHVDRRRPMEASQQWSYPNIHQTLMVNVWWMEII